jgi:phosphatidylinositol glycan class A protein
MEGHDECLCKLCEPSLTSSPRCHKHTQVRNVLCRGSIFVNCSLTESFCIAILEAASCGLLVVSTRVGGVPEVLPPDMIHFANTPTPQALLEGLAAALTRVDEIDPFEFHNRVKLMYSWRDVATKTAQVYDSVRSRESVPWFERLLQYYRLGPVAGLLAFAVVSLDIMFYTFLRWWCPDEDIEHAVDVGLTQLLAREQPQQQQRQ